MPRRPPPVPAPLHLPPIRFATYLEARALELPPGQRGERSRLKLMASGLRRLDGCEYPDLRIEEVGADAGLAKGSFYVHFRSKDEFLRALAEAYCGFESQMLPRRAPQSSRFADTMMWVGWYERSFAANVGILRCLVQMASKDARMRELWMMRNQRIVLGMLADTLRDTALDEHERHLLLGTLRSVGGMLDQSLFDRYGVQAPTGRQDPEDLERAIERHAVLCHRALFGEDPPAADLEYAAALAALSRKLR